MTTEEKIQIQAFRKVGMGYKQISKEMGISVNSIKSFCQRNGLGEAKNGPVCEQCGKAVLYTPKKKKKRFCSDSCRQAWWNSHLDMVKRKAFYEYACPVCGKEFSVYGNSKRKYCSHGCYIVGRFGSDE